MRVLIYRFAPDPIEAYCLIKKYGIFINMVTDRNIVVVLAAGMGKRMRSQKPKVMHHLAGRPILYHVLDNLEFSTTSKNILVISQELNEMSDLIKSDWPDIELVIQNERLGTGHALKVADEFVGGFSGKVAVLYGDVPLLSAATLNSLREAGDSQKADISLLSFRPQSPKGYGRLVCNSDDQIIRIIEQSEIDGSENDISLCNTGIISADGKVLSSLLQRLSNDNSKGEYFLTDIFSIATSDGLKCIHVEAEDNNEVLGINDRSQLAKLENIIQEQLRNTAMESGVTLVDPSSTWLSWDTSFGEDVEVEPNVVFGRGVRVGAGSKILAFSHIEGAIIGNNAIIGPFARLRPETILGENVKIGNFVEAKKAVFGESAKVNHLSYIGDAEIGQEANIGAGTITCNYDGQKKSKTVVGKGAFVGSNSSLVAPLSIGDGAIVGAGSVITQDVSTDSVVLARCQQEESLGAAQRRRDRSKDEQDD
tara:strand:+ start:1442 stop:2881 length:1440 start_codon:yes stop_codon:yes gene_type:complete